MAGPKISDHKDITLSTIRIDDREQLCACYRMGVAVSLQNRLAVGTTKAIMRAYRDAISEGIADFLEDSDRHQMGPVVKEYWLTYGTKKFIILGMLGFGTMSEVKSEFVFREEAYDQIVSTFTDLDGN